MLTDNVIEFMNYKNALKGNYRKGVHTMRCILENPAQAADFAASVGAVSVVFGAPVDKPDRNSDELLELVLNSSVCDKATLTFLSQFYPENAESYDTMMNSAERCAEIFATPILWRPVGRSNCLTAKLIVTMAGLNCVDYGDLAAVVSSSVAMTAVAASQTAMAAVAASSTAMTAVAASQTAMTAVAASPTAMAAIWQSSTAVQVVQNNATAWSTFTGASSSVIGKTVAILSGLDPNSYADMTAVAASQTAMAAVAASSTAMAAVAASSTAMAAVIANSTALNAVVSSSTAMAAVAASSTAMTAVAASSRAMQAVAMAWNTTESAITGSTVAMNALKNSGKCQTVSKDVSGAKSVSFITGLCFVFTAEITVSGGACYIEASRPTGGTTLSLCSSKTAATVNKFCKDPYVKCTNSSHSYASNKLYFYKIS